MPIKWRYALKGILAEIQYQQEKMELEHQAMERKRRLEQERRQNQPSSWWEQKEWDEKEEKLRGKRASRPYGGTGFVCLQVSLLNDKGKVVGKSGPNNPYYYRTIFDFAQSQNEDHIYFNREKRGVKAKDITDNMNIRLDAVAIFGLYDDYFYTKFESTASLQARGLVRVGSEFRGIITDYPQKDADKDAKGTIIRRNTSTYR